MTEGEVRQLAEKIRGKHDIPDSFKISNIMQQVIEFVSNSIPDENVYLVRDCLVWTVLFSKGSKWIELAIDDAIGKVVRITKSRS